MAFRRKNKSSKVPNVKLRPAAPNTSSSSRRSKLSNAQDSFRSHDSGFDSEVESSFADVCTPRPFRGVIICATGVSDKTTLFKQAIELGAQPLNDLTDKVTHLLAVEPGSAKYKCALENHIPIMHPSWISDSYQVWLKGDDVDIQESIRQHRLPIFSGVVLCVSGLNDVARRTEINRRVTAESGSYVKNIERPVKVTHLLCSSGAEDMTEKMLYAAKFNKQKEANICMVWEEWFWDSLRLGGRCAEDSYNISQPRPARQPTPEPASSPPRSSSPDLGFGGESLNVPSVRKRDAGGLKADEGEEEAAIAVKRVPAVTLQIWGSILRPRGFELQHGRLIRSPSKLQKPPVQLDNEADDSPVKAKGKGRSSNMVDPGDDLGAPQSQSALASFRRSHLYASQPKDASSQRLFRRVPTAPNDPDSGNIPAGAVLAQPVASSSTSVIARNVTNEARDRTKGAVLFSGLTFWTLGEARCPRVRTALEEAGGRVVGEASDEPVNFIIVRLVSGSKIFREEIDEQHRVKYRTECWLERCFSEERICPPDDHISFIPLSIAIPVPGAQTINLSVSGLEESEACWIGRLARALGINFLASTFSRRCSHLLCPAKTGAKYEKAMEWNIPVVDMQWLAEIVSTGCIDTSGPRVPRSARLDEHTDDIASDARCDRIQEANDGLVAATDEMKPRSQGQSDHQSGLQSSPIGEDDYLAVEPFGQPVGLLQDTPNTTEKPDEHLALSKYALSESGNICPTMSLAELRHDMQNTRIPSSASPSPIKAPSSSNSPAKISREATKVLQESITSLLGKRMSNEDIDSNHSSRPKRPRPPSRTKVNHRQGSSTSAERNNAANDPSRGAFEPFIVPEEDVTMLSAERGQLEDSVRVTYEDPAQNDEKLRLMKLLETQRPKEIWETDSHSSSSAEEKSSRRRKPATRRSTRVAGFETPCV